MGKLKGFDSLGGMTGNSMKSILDSTVGAGQWKYEEKSLPYPKEK